MKKYFTDTTLYLFLTCLMLSAWLGPVSAQQTTTVLSPAADTWVRSTGADKTVNYGSDTTFMTRHSASSYIEIAFLKFDLTGLSLPQHTVIDSAKLFLTMVYNQSSGGVVNILRMDDSNDGWDEHTITWSSGRPDTVHGVGAIASLPVARLNPQASSDNGIVYGFDVTGQLITELSDSNKIFSMAVYPNYKTDVNIKFLSRESSIAGLRPRLVIYKHTLNPNSFDFTAFSDTYNKQIQLSWKTINEPSIAYYRILHSTDGNTFNDLAHVDTRGAGSDTVQYTYAHGSPGRGQTHYYKIETILKDSSTTTSTAVSATYGLTGMVARNIWEFTQVPSIAATSARLMQSLQMADFNPVGLRATAGVPLVINVDLLSGTDLPKLIIGTYDREPVSKYDLHAGINSITNAGGGDLYIQYSADNASPDNRVRVSFQSGYQQMPLYRLGSTTHQQWIDQLSADSGSPNVTLISDRVFIVVSKQKAIQYQGANQDTLLTYMDEIMRTEDEISGLDNSLPVHAPAYGNKLMLLEKASGNPDATSLGRVRIPTGSVSWILDPAYITDHGGWGIFHEIGHHHQQYPWSWSACTEVTVNIYSMAAKRFFHPGQPGMASSDWDKTMAYLEQPDSVKEYNSSANYVKLGLWNQMGMAFDDGFYQALHKRTREDRIVPSGNTAEIRLMMLYACQISGRDLSHFFRKWGLPADSSVYGEIAALGLPAPSTDPSELREDWAVRVERISDPDNLDSIVLNASAYGPQGVKKVEFYANGSKIGQSDSRPFNFTWKNVAPGNYTITVKATGTGDTVVTGLPLNLEQKAVAISYPANNSSFASGSSIDIQAAVSATSQVAKVSFFANEQKIGESLSAPYHYNWVTHQDGIYSLRAKVAYQGGGSDSSSITAVGRGAFLPVADAYVRDGGSAGSNFGTDNTLVVKKDIGGYNRISYLKFDLANYAGHSDSLALLMQIASANHSVSATQWQLWLCHATDWQEHELTWNNRPSADSLLATVDTKSSGEVQWKITGDVQELLAQDRTLCLAVVSTTVNGTSDASFYSRDADAVGLRPYLKIYGTAQTAVAVTYSPLKASISDKDVHLQWRTFTERQTVGFLMERSVDGVHFEQMGRVAADGSATAGSDYTFTDKKPAAGVNYYRFREITPGGTGLYSNTAAISYFAAGHTAVWKLYPNPLSEGRPAYIDLPAGYEGKVAVRITNLSGQCLYNQIYATHHLSRLPLNTTSLSPGIYFVQVISEKGTPLASGRKLIVR